MAENLTQFRAGVELLTLLKQHELPKDAVNAVIYKVAEIVEEALQAGKHSGPAGQAGSRSFSTYATSALMLSKV